MVKIKIWKYEYIKMVSQNGIMIAKYFFIFYPPILQDNGSSVLERCNGKYGNHFAPPGKPGAGSSMLLGCCRVPLGFGVPCGTADLIQTQNIGSCSRKMWNRFYYYYYSYQFFWASIDGWLLCERMKQSTITGKNETRQLPRESSWFRQQEQRQSNGCGENLTFAQCYEIGTDYNYVDLIPDCWLPNAIDLFFGGAA